MITAVPLFLIVSGYLASKSTKEKDLQWLARKSRRLLIPYYIILIPIIITYLIEGLIDTFQIIILGINMQGLKNYLFYNFSYASPPGLGHFWFITIIFLCYVILLIFEKAVTHLNKLRCSKYLFILALILSPFLSTLCGIQILYILSFFLGYLIGQYNLETRTNFFWISFALFIFSIFLRFESRQIIDETDLYILWIAPFTNICIALFIFNFIFQLEKFQIIKHIGNNPLIIHAEVLSYEIYLVHYIFIKGPFPVGEWFNNKLISYTCGIICILSISWAVNRFSSSLNSILMRK